MGHKVLAFFTLLAGLTPAVFGLPTFTVTLAGFPDPNGNGAVDCGEEFELDILVYDDTPVVSPIAPRGGTITIPTTTFQTGWQYSPGSIALDNTRTDNCSIVTILAGNAPGDDRAVFRYSCLPSPTPGPSGHLYFLAARIRGIYIGTTGPYFVTAENALDSGEILTADLTGSNVQGCPQADLSLTKTDGGFTALQGQTVAYTLGYANAGDPAEDAVLRETVPANTTANLAVSSPGWSCSPSSAAGSTCILALGDLPAGAVGNRTFAVDVLPTTTASLITNTAGVTTTTPETNTANNSASDTTPVSPGDPDLELVKSVSGSSASPGSIVVFTLGVRNLGNGLTQNTAVQDTLPPGTTLEASASTPGWTCASSVCQFDLGTFVAGAARSLTLALRLPNPVPFNLTRLDNTACVSTTTAEPTGNNCGNASTPVIGAPDLSLDKSLDSGQGVPGSTLTFRLAITNNGNRDSGPVTLTETVPQHTTAQPSAAWTCSPDLSAGSVCTTSLPSIPGGGGTASRTFSVTVDSPLPQAADVVHNSACMTSPGTAQACDDIDVPTDATAMIMLSKALTSGSPVPGAVLSYTLTAQNTGNRASLPVVLTETVPQHTSFESASSSPGWACSSNVPPATCTLNVGSIAGGGATASRIFAVRVINPLPAIPGDIRNTACAQLPGSPDHCDEITVTPQGSPMLGIRKLLASGAPAPGELVTYRIEVSNSGDQHADNVLVTDELPPFTSVETAASSAWTCTSSSCTVTLPLLEAGSSTTLTLALRVSGTLPATAELLINRACATDGPRSVCDSVETPLGGAPVLTITKSYSGPALRAGADLPFTVSVSNTGNRDAMGAVLREVVPDGAVFLPSLSDPRWVCSDPVAGSPCTLTLDLAAGATDSASFIVRALSPLPEGIRQVANTACVLTPAGDVAACDETSTPLPTFVELTLRDSIADDRNGNGSLDDNDLLHYTLVVSNPADQPAVNLMVTTAIDPHLALVVGSVTASAGSILQGNSQAHSSPVVALPHLDPGESMTIEFDALAIDVSAAKIDHVSTQAQATGPEIAAEASDDPDTALDDDPTLTPVGGPSTPPSGVHDVPALSTLGLFALAVTLALVAFAILRHRA